MIALLVMSDGRPDYLQRTLRSAAANLRGPITQRFLYDETGDDDYRRRLAHWFPDFERIGDPGPRRGFGGAIDDAWRILRERCGPEVEWVFHLECDFTWYYSVDLADFVAVMQDRPYLAQMALRRQPWNDAERAAGGIVEQHPQDYTEMRDGRRVWLEHRRFWTTNPSLYRRSLMERGFPTHAEAEGHFGIRLFAEDPATRSGYWGPKDSGPWVEHIGQVRAGNVY